MNKNKVYLIDGSGYIFRAYYAVAPLSNKAGLPTNALYGFTRMILKLLSDADSDNVIMFFDTGQKTFRSDIYPEYKANRSECPEDLIPQMPYFRTISETLGLRTFELPGYEADDLIGTFADKLSAQDIETVIVSADKDLMQLVNNNVSIHDTMRDKKYQAKEVKEKYDVTPQEFSEYLALTGDTSDNIPGLSGVGPKTAAALVNKYGDVESIIAAAAEIAEDKTIRNRKKIADTIQENPEILRLSRKLVQIKLDVPLDALNVEEDKLLELAKRVDIQDSKLEALINELEFHSLFDGAILKKKEAEAEYITVLANNFPEFLKNLHQEKEFAFDLETTSLDILEAKIVGASFCWEGDKAYYVPLAHKNTGAEQVSVQSFLEAVREILENPEIKKIGQNLKYDLNVLRSYNIDFNGLAFDTMLAAYLLNPDQGSYNLTRLSADYLGFAVTEFSEATESVADFSETDLQTATHYAAQDAHYAWLLKEKLEPLIKKEELHKLLQEVEQPLVYVLADLERNGIKLDAEFLKQMSGELESSLQSLSGEIQELAGEEFNLNSPKQLAYILFEKLGISSKGIKKTKTGISTNAASLEKLARIHPLPAKILDYRELFKLKSTYVDALPGFISKISGRLHSNFNQTVTATGRLSSSKPNLQNIPVAGDAGRKIRQAFVAEDKHVLLSADYSQIELRILAHLSHDRNLTSAFENNLDIHTETAKEVLGLSDDHVVSTEERRIGKTMNFGIIYGMSGFRLANTLEIPVGVATEYISDYFNYYSGVKKYFEDLEREVVESSCVKTLLGRKRYISGIDTSGRDKGFLLRAALNAPVQGSAADIIKLAMIQLYEVLKRQKLPAKMLLQVHDEILLEVEKSALEQISKVVKETMESAYKLSVPLVINIETGSNWGEIH